MANADRRGVDLVSSALSSNLQGDGLHSMARVGRKTPPSIVGDRDHSIPRWGTVGEKVIKMLMRSPPINGARLNGEYALDDPRRHGRLVSLAQPRALLLDQCFQNLLGSLFKSANPPPIALPAHAANRLAEYVSLPNSLYALALNNDMRPR